MHQPQGSVSARPSTNGTCVTDAASPLGISKGSGRGPWLTLQASQEEMFRMGTPENTTVLSMCTQHPGHAFSHTSLSPPPSPHWEQSHTFHCLGRQLGAGQWLGVQNTLQGAVLASVLAVGTTAGWEGVFRAGGKRRRLQIAPQRQEGVTYGYSR